MKPIPFPNHNRVLGRNQPQYLPLPVHIDADGVVISCWLLSPEETQRLVDTRLLWLSQLTFGAALQPQLPSVDPPAKLGISEPVLDTSLLEKLWHRACPLAMHLSFYDAEGEWITIKPTGPPAPADISRHR